MTLKFPADFDKCTREGGRVRTIPVKDHPEQYMHICYDKAGKSYAGEVKTKKEASEVADYLKNVGYTEKNNEFIRASETKIHRLIPQIELNEKNFSDKNPISEIEILHTGEWEHPQYGMIKITDKDIDTFISSFNDKVRKVDIAVDQEHMPEKGAAGWFRSMKKVFEDNKTKLKATVEWTKLGTQLIKDGIFKYFSPEFDFEYEDLETHERFDNVLLGGALTNRPYFKSLAPIELSENMFAGFTSMKGGEKEMTKEELKAKLAEDAEFVLAEDASEEEKVAFEEAQAELAKDAEDKEEAEKAAIEAAEKIKDGAICTLPDGKEGVMKDGKCVAGSVAGSERFILRAEHLKEMNELKSKMGIVEAKLRFKEVQGEVSGYVFSESNPNGVLLPKNREAAVNVLMASSPKTAKLFTDFLAGLPKVSTRLFREEGGEGKEKGDKYSEIEIEVKKLMEAKGGLTYGEAIKIVSREKPELFKK